MSEARLSPHAEKPCEIATWGLDQIQTSLLPRIIQSASDQELIDARVAFDDARTRLRIATVARTKGKIYDYFPNVQNLLTNASAVYELLCKRW